jgi:3-phosphoglycerate kinase
LAELLGRPVEFADDCIGESAKAAIERASQRGKVVLLENLRFHAEEKNDSGFAKRLRRSRMSTSTTRSAPRTGPMPRPKASCIT